MTLIPRAVNATLFNSVMQRDGIIDVNATTLASLQTMGVLPVPSNNLPGINDQQFNNLFSTNGFVILTSADDIDQIYYNEVNPVQNLQRFTAADPATVFYQSVVTNVQQVPVCAAGVAVGTLKQVDYVQKKVVIGCVACLFGMYFDAASRSCVCYAGMIYDSVKNVCNCPTGTQLDSLKNTCISLVLVPSSTQSKTLK